MNILVIGSGAREHAILWKLAKSPRTPRLFVAPGNAGTGALATNLPVGVDDIDGLITTVRAHAIDITIVGPDNPLEAGVVDRFQAEGLPIFGPTKAADRIEASKSFAKQLMAKAGIPTADFRVFDNFVEASDYVRFQGAPIVVKAVGLTAGKGVVVAQSVEEAIETLEALMNRRIYGTSGDTVIIEECLTGQELSVFAFTDGAWVSSLGAACDYKRVGDGDTGPNTGGMGAYSPPYFWTPSLEQHIRDAIMVPVINALAEAGTPYLGVLYGGLMLTETGPKVIEFNARFGDPEAQVILPRLENDLLEVVEAVVCGKGGTIDVRWAEQATVGVVLASEGYPGHYATGKAIEGLDTLAEGALAFHSGTTLTSGKILSSGGRVVTLVGTGADMATARQLAYAAAASVRFEGVFHRNDIASPAQTA